MYVLHFRRRFKLALWSCLTLWRARSTKNKFTKVLQISQKRTERRKGRCRRFSKPSLKPNSFNPTTSFCLVQKHYRENNFFSRCHATGKKQEANADTTEIAHVKGYLLFCINLWNKKKTKNETRFLKIFPTGLVPTLKPLVWTNENCLLQSPGKS